MRRLGFSWMDSTCNNNCSLLAVIFLTVLLPRSEAQKPSGQQMKNGIIVLTAFEGDVKIITTTNDQPLNPSKGAVLKQGHVVITGANSKASLAFENGIGMEVAPSTKFVIQEFSRWRDLHHNAVFKSQ